MLSAFLPFAKQKRNQFWVWSILAEIFAEDSEKQFACYCKALSLKNTKEDFLVKIRQEFASILIVRKMFSEAKYEIEKVISTREKMDWKIPSQLNQWSNAEWYSTTNPPVSNKKLYLKFAPIAEEILYQDVPAEIVVVEFVNENKHVINFVQNERKSGFFKYTGLLEKPKIGDILSVRFIGDANDSFYKVATAKKADDNTQSDAIKRFAGELKILTQKTFGFVGDIFFSPELINQCQLNNGDIIKGKAILSFNKAKKQWGWKAIEANEDKKI